MLNLIPIPGLDGYGAIEPWLPAEVRDWGRRFKPYGLFLMVILFIGVPEFGGFFRGAVGGILEMLRVDEDLWRAGLGGMRIFR